MNEILIQNENQPELRFNGQLFSETQFEIDLEDSENRDFKLRVYAIDGGGFVSMLSYDSSSLLENQICCYEDMDQFKDVENFFYVFEANEVIQGYDRMNRNDRERAALTSKRIASVYESTLFKFLDQVRHRATQLNFGDRVPAITKTSLLRTLGFKRD